MSELLPDGRTVTAGGMARCRAARVTFALRDSKAKRLSHARRSGREPKGTDDLD